MVTDRIQGLPTICLDTAQTHCPGANCSFGGVWQVAFCEEQVECRRVMLLSHFGEGGFTKAACAATCDTCARNKNVIFEGGVFAALCLPPFHNPAVLLIVMLRRSVFHLDMLPYCCPGWGLRLTAGGKDATLYVMTAEVLSSEPTHQGHNDHVDVIAMDLVAFRGGYVLCVR